MDWFLAAMRRFATFRGRARRPEYWYTVLFFFLISIVLGIADEILGVGPREVVGRDGGGGLPAVGGGLLGGLFALVMIVPMFAVGARRLHDIGRSGWWQLVGFVPLVGALVLLYWFVQPGDAADNAHGPPPPESPPA